MSLLGLQRHGYGPTVVWLHGFTQTRDSAHSFRTILAGTNELLTLDLPGHGENAPLQATLNETADLLALKLGEKPFILGGYSLGARVALHFALKYPERLRGLVVLSATRGIERARERGDRRLRDEGLANRIEEVGTETFLDEWLAQPLFSSLPRDPLERAARSHDASGMANSLRRAGTGTQEWLSPRLATLGVPTLSLAGELDEKFTREATAIATAIPNGDVAIIVGAGHAAHVERPGLSAAPVQRFISQL